MKKRIFGMLLMGAMVIASMSMFTSCKDYDDDIQANKNEIAALKSQLTSELTSIRTQLASDLAAAKSELSTAIAAKADKSDLDGVAKKTDVDAKADASELTALAAKVAALETQLAAIEDALSKTASSADVAELEDQVVALAALLAAQTGEIEDLKAALAAVQNAPLANAEVQAEVLAATANVGLQEAALELLSAKVDALQAQVAGGIDQDVIDALKKDIDAAKKDISDLEKSIAKCAKLSDLDKYAKLTDLNGFAKASDLNAYAKLTDLAAYVKSADLAAYVTAADLEKTVKKEMQALSNKVDTFSGDINVLKVFVKRNLTSINLSPAKFYGGIEGIDIFAFTPKEEKMYDNYHYFMKGNAVTLSEIGTADYHISPKSVDLTKFDVNFFTRTSDIIEPATTEQTRAVSNTNRVKPVYTKTDDLIAKKLWNATTGILTVPYKVDDAKKIADELKAGKGTIAALQLSKDTTVTSDYALVVPTLAELLLICDKTFAPKNTGADWNDVPGLNNGAVNTYHLHRNFSYLAVAQTTATHEIVYNGSFNISEVLLTHAVDYGVNVKDTTVLTPHKATAEIANYDPSKDSDATLPKKVCTELSAAKLAELGLYYDVHRVGYSLGTTNTEESNHIEILQNENGDFIAYPRNISGVDGSTVTGQTANASAVGRMPIVCIELKYQKGDKPAASDPTVSFAYMKFLIVKGTEPAPVAKTAEFTVSDVWADCGDASGEVKWYQIEANVYNEKLGLDKETFDERYVFDFYKELTEANETDKTKSKDKRFGYRFKKSGSGFAHDKDSIGQVVEEWNLSTQGKLDATTHIIKWYFSTADYIKVYKDLKARGKLAYDWEKGQMTNTEEIVTYVRYAYRSTYHKGNMNVADGDPALYIKLTIPVGYFHFALGSLGGTKTLTYWYELNSANNAPDAKSAKEVRVNVPVPVPDAKTTTTVLSALSCPWSEPLQIINDNLLERTEFLKDLHDYFRNGQLSAAVTDKTHFKKLAANKITPEFKFTLPSKSLGNATFDAKNGTWSVKGISGKSYTLKLYNNDSEIRISPYNKGDILCSLTKDNDGIQSVIKYHEGEAQDDILNFMSHNDLGELETFTAYIMIDTPDACAPIEFDDMWFNVRFLRPLDLTDPAGGILPDAPNDWQYINLADYADVYDWRDYKADPLNRIQGDDKSVSGYRVDFKYYQVDLNTDEDLFLTDAGLGTNERDASMTVGQMININKDKTYKAKLWKTAEVNGLLVQKTDKKGGDQVPNTYKTTWIRYKNNSGVTGGFHIYLPIQMSYVFGNYPQTTQLKYVTLGITKSVNQDQSE